jgi:hypothetical protein
MIAQLTFATAAAAHDLCTSGEWVKSGEIFGPQEQQHFASGATITVSGYWQNPNKELRIHIHDPNDGSTAATQTIFSSSTASVFSCTLPPCPSNINRYAFSGMITLPNIPNHAWNIFVINPNSDCNFAKPIDGACFFAQIAGGATYCQATAGGKDGTCGTGYRNVQVWTD